MLLGPRADETRTRGAAGLGPHHKPYVKSGKKDRVAGATPTMPKPSAKPAHQITHRPGQRTPRPVGLIMPLKGVPACRRLIAEVLEDGENGLPGLMRRMLFQLSDELTQRDHEIVELDEAIKQQCKTDERIKRLL